MRVSLLVASLAAAASVLVAPTQALAANPYERGPAPTNSSIEASRGTYAVSQTTVARQSGFGGGTIYYPTSTADGTFGAVAISPGFTATQSSVAWLGPRLASQGFVVITINTLSTWDQPDSRGTQLLAALDYLTNTSSVRTRIDATRLGVMGHSMGGGGSLAAARTRPALQAAVPMTPWHGTKSWGTVRVPTMIIGAENDTVAPVSSHSEPFYTSMSSAPEKAYLEVNNATHSAPTEGGNVTVAKYALSWLKRFIDNDTRYDQFLCPAPSGSTIQEYRATCPHA
ncbi:putative lipase [Actinoplanes missouriensis 431]|uniref:Putative lipase n=1 Tax=Actinoplanes missouriensis (strain ATCC 14538 / DSM 43046 / CBS 188.64 / JCM 3121 / NBRC 102363 / NCIMB 12654 / NRRL B-3342 / UNCC 431) TaxID=512565 RepID=I0H6N3_ACTM4|nr:dienelactone hydrolase family protein [Actinoplanes missouriensis]BAL88670.1 putative lipase [Actinoplanes missouriensis 431]